MKLQRRKHETQKSFMTTRAVLLTGVVLTSAFAGTVAYANSIISNSGAGICVTAVWIDDPDINAQRGECSSEEVIIPPDETENNAVIATYTCGPAKVEITQAMQDHSDKNLELKNSGKENEMIPWPHGGWSIILPGAAYDPSISGAIFTTKGEFNPANNKNLHNSSGITSIFRVGDVCLAYNIVNEVAHSENEPATYQSNGDILTVAYMKNGVKHRDGDLPSVIETTKGEITGLNYHKEGKFHRVGKPAIYIKNDINGAASEGWFVDGVEHRLDGPSNYMRTNSNGFINILTFRINGVEMKTKDEWIAAGGLADAWFTRNDFPNWEDSPEILPPK